MKRPCPAAEKPARSRRCPSCSPTPDHAPGFCTCREAPPDREQTPAEARFLQRDREPSERACPLHRWVHEQSERRAPSDSSDVRGAPRRRPSATPLTLLVASAGAQRTIQVVGIHRDRRASHPRRIGGQARRRSTSPSASRPSASVAAASQYRDIYHLRAPRWLFFEARERLSVGRPLMGDCRAFDGDADQAQESTVGGTNTRAAKGPPHVPR